MMSLYHIRIEDNVPDYMHSYRYRRRRYKRHHKDRNDDVSLVWSLPSWPEFDDERHATYQRRRRSRRNRKADLDNIAIGSAGVDLASGSLATSATSQLDDIETAGEEEEPRQAWTNRCEFLFSMITMCVGIGNVYRFPYICYTNGAGAFLIPYVIIMIFVGRPLYFMELAVGQFSTAGQVKCWRMCPLFKGVGFGSAVGCFYVLTYSSAVMCIAVYYMIASCQAVLPWSQCDPTWATQEVCDKYAEAAKNGTSPKNMTRLPRIYYEKATLNELKSIDHGIGLPCWKLSLCLLGSWLIIIGILLKGVKSFGKVSYVISLYPFLVLFTLLGFSMTKPGAFTGMLYFIIPKWGKIFDPNVWFAAAGQAFFSISVAYGPVINYASYNAFHDTIYKDVIIVSIVDTVASFLAGLAVFAVLGYLSFELGVEIDEVVSSGPGLIFVSFSDALTNFPVPQLFSVMFFLMMVVLSTGMIVSYVMAITSIIADQFPQIKQIYIIMSVCIAGFLFALVYVTPGGQHVLVLVDNFGGTVNIYILATLESIGVAWVYGLRNFVRDVEFMFGHKVGWYWKISWSFFIPIFLLFIMVNAFASLKPLEYNGQVYPTAALACGWVVTAISLLPVPIGAAYAMYKSSGSLKQRFLNAIKPTPDFGPKHPRDRVEWELLKAGKLELYDNLTEGNDESSKKQDTPTESDHEVEPEGPSNMAQVQDAENNSLVK